MYSECGIEKGKKEKRVWLTDRDAKILKFILEMKFSSRTEIYEKFFKVNKDGSQSVSEHWAKERLGLLCKSGLLRREMVYRESKSYYQVTKMAARWLDRNFFSGFICKPPREIDFRIFEHDRLLLKCRLQIEKQFPGCVWISDKELNENPEYTSLIYEENRPDALIITPEGKRIAFELELTTKSKHRYRQKIDAYVHNWRWEKEKKYVDAVMYVCSKKSLFESIKVWTEIWPELFEVKLLDKFLEI